MNGWMIRFVPLKVEIPRNLERACPYDVSGGAPLIPAPPEAAGSQLLYAMSGPEEPQTHLAPFFVKIDNDDGSRWPASTYSLVVELVQEVTTSGVVLTAAVAPARGPLSYAWGFWNIIGTDAALRHPAKTKGHN